MLLLIDNYDSFTYNLVQYCQMLGVEPRVVRNDALSLEQLIELEPTRLIISPGPCTPAEAGLSIQAIDYFLSRIPILGVCLGHQAIISVMGGAIVRAAEVMHGRVCCVNNDGSGLFSGLPSTFNVTRYHSLVADPDTLPASLRVNAWHTTAEGVTTIMGVQHERYPVSGVQFHPESVASEYGHELLANFFRQ